MARDYFSNTAAKADPTNANALIPLSNISVTVKVGGTSTVAQIYQARTGTAQGPAPAAGATGNNPFTTGATGSVEFWAEAGDYDITFVDLQTPPRISGYTAGWQSVSGATGGIPASLVGTLTLAQIPVLDTSKLPTIPNSKLDSILKAKLEQAVQDALHAPGDMKFSAQTTDHSGWLKCDGRNNILSATYPNLAAIVGTTFGAGSTGAHFALPDLRGRVPVGSDSSSGRLTANGAIGNVGGTEKVALNIFEMPTHEHTLKMGAGNVPAHDFDAIQGSGAAPTDSTAPIDPNGAGVAHNNMQPFQVANWFIKT